MANREGSPSDLIEQGKFIRVPLLIGANTDEGSSFGSSSTLSIPDNETVIFDNLLYYRSYAITPPTCV
jgi:cholinesterase